MEAKTLEDLKVGDSVFYAGRSVLGVYIIKRLTRTQIILKGGARFRKSDGSRIGEGRRSTLGIKLLTPERLESFKLLRLKNKATALRDNLIVPADKETLEKFITALSPFIKANVSEEK